MAESMVVTIDRKLKPHYRCQLFGGREWAVLHEPVNGRAYWITDPNTSLTIRFKNEPTPPGRLLDNIIAALRRAGAIQEPKQRTFKPREPVKVKYNAPKNAVIIAEETLKDSRATPRERALARNYLELFNSHKTVRELARRLGHKLKDLEKKID